MKEKSRSYLQKETIRNFGRVRRAISWVELILVRLGFF